MVHSYALLHYSCEIVLLLDLCDCTDVSFIVWQVESGETDYGLCHPVLVFRTTPSSRVAFPFPNGDPV